jgi:hypothetical protein
MFETQIKNYVGNGLDVQKEEQYNLPSRICVPSLLLD